MSFFAIAQNDSAEKLSEQSSELSEINLKRLLLKLVNDNFLSGELGHQLLLCQVPFLAEFLQRHCEQQ